jgi:hypothetical protein
LPQGERESIAIESIQGIQVTRKQIGDYKQAGIFFFLLGLLSLWFLIGFVFIVLGIAAMWSKIYIYRLTVRVNGNEILLLEHKSKGRTKSLAQTIRGLLTAKGLKTSNGLT